MAWKAPCHCLLQVVVVVVVDDPCRTCCCMEQLALQMHLLRQARLRLLPVLLLLGTHC